ncbi:phytanoyl-CoA dioxygenase family protein [Aureliella helgolandensis]|uniref:Phytanoyl-CoA dioxygenase (PhyH) n=1 Tax=Aureliella helgolandensis TaxID=2527968 RepID=A0A518GG78_9BACT|nr:phytanoyl-CoA dioxygenase family protein [Aureliella helgolandensis]QDV27604.1 Phytanoyl-CoA dioxygenase (PhyH) [Aureliella helgolandensis]
MNSTWNPQLCRDGCQFLPQVLEAHQLAEVSATLERLLVSEDEGVLRSRGTAYGVRNLLRLWPEVVDLVRLPAVREQVQSILGERGGVVRGLVFDKPPERSWTLPWHRDRTLAIERVPEDLLDFAHPTHKAGTAHILAPNWLLGEMLTLRFSIDPMTAENGPLVVMPGSHQTDSAGDGDLDAPNTTLMQTVFCDAGDVFMMRPLLAHSSLVSQAGTSMRRRIIHLELCSREQLPGEFCWEHFLRI